MPTSTTTLVPFLQRLQTDYPEFWTWLQSRPNNLTRVTSVASSYEQKATGAGYQQYTAFIAWLTGESAVYKLFAETPTAEELPAEALPAEEPPAEDPYAKYLEDVGAADIRGAFSIFLQENGLPLSLTSFIEGAIGQKWSYDEIVARLRQTPEYLAAYPENALRQQAGLSWWPEAQIREYRDRVRMIVKQYLGIAPTEVSNEEIAHLVANGVDLGEWERRIQTHQAFLQWGPAVQQALSLELGYDLPDERTWAFMNPDIETPELDLAYRRAMMRGQPAVLGFGLRPSEEADILVKMGFSPEEAFRGYQGVAEELPRVERMKMIDNYLQTQEGKTPTNPLGEAGFGLLFRALMLNDVDAHDILSKMLARSTALWQAGGGPTGGGAGLLQPELR